MFCTKCGSPINDDAEYCVVCGKATSSRAQSNDATASPTPHKQPAPPRAAKKRKHIALACGCLVAMLVLGIGGFFASKAFLPSALGFVFINQAAFPDESFRGFIAEHVDTDHSGIITPDESAAVTQLDFTALQDMTYSPSPVSSLEEPTASIAIEGRSNDGISNDGKDLDEAAQGIISLEGIEHLSHLKSLNCANMGLAALDLSKCPSLVYVDCRGNKFTALDLANNKALSCLYCDDDVQIGGLAEAGLCSDDLLTYAEMTGEIYDASGRELSSAALQISYDMQGRMVASTRPDKTCLYRYNEKSNLVEVVTEAISNARILEYTDTYAYTDEGLPLSSAKHAISNRYDGPLHVVEPYEYTSQYTYDEQGRLNGEKTMVPSRFEDYAISTIEATYRYNVDTGFLETSDAVTTFSGDFYKNATDPGIISKQYFYNDVGSLSSVRSSTSGGTQTATSQITYYADNASLALSNTNDFSTSERLVEYTSFNELGFPVETSCSGTDLARVAYTCNRDGYITDVAWSFFGATASQDRTLKMSYVKHVGGAAYKSMRGTLPQFIFSSTYPWIETTHLSNLLWQPDNGIWLLATVIELDPLMRVKEAYLPLSGTIRSGSRVDVDESGNVVPGNWPWKVPVAWIPDVSDETLAQLIVQDLASLSTLQAAKAGNAGGDASSGNGVQQRASLPDYSWEELSSISKQVEACTNTAEAFEIAKKFNLVDDEGKATGTVKTFSLSDGTTLEAQVVGVLQDDKADGTGKAGLSFITKECYANHRMNATETNSGGWRDSEMRGWLNTTVLDWFPNDIKGRIVEVKKLTNNVGRTETADSVSETSDKIWLFSWAEMFGPVTWNKGSDQAYIDTVLNAEGTQYQLFADYGLADSQSSDTKGILQKHVISDPSKPLSNWWVRSPTPNRTDGFGDVNNGAIDNGGLATASQGVVFGFCL